MKMIEAYPILGIGPAPYGPNLPRIGLPIPGFRVDHKRVEIHSQPTSHSDMADMPTC